MDQDLMNQARLALEAGRRFAFATVVESTLKGTPRKAGAKMIVFEDGSAYGTIGGGRYEKDAQQKCRQSIRSRKSQLITYEYFGQTGQSICGGQLKVFIEPYIEKKSFILCGAGHIALPLSLIVKTLDYQLTVIDNRRTFANKNRYPHADRILVGKHAEKLKRCTINADTYIMIVTHGNEFDYECLRTVIDTPAGYIGCISSKTKRIKFFRRLRDEAGASPQQLKRISIPAGLDLGAQTPAEIAISIGAELVQLNNRDRIHSDKFTDKQHRQQS